MLTSARSVCSKPAALAGREHVTLQRFSVSCYLCNDSPVFAVLAFVWTHLTRSPTTAWAACREASDTIAEYRLDCMQGGQEAQGPGEGARGFIRERGRRDKACRALRRPGFVSCGLLCHPSDGSIYSDVCLGVCMFAAAIQALRIRHPLSLFGSFVLHPLILLLGHLAKQQHSMVPSCRDRHSCCALMQSSLGWCALPP